jgi:hypothetical protein
MYTYHVRLAIPRSENAVCTISDIYTYNGAQISQKSRSHLKTLGARRVHMKYHTEDPQILNAAVQNLVAQATWRPGFVHPCTPKFVQSNSISRHFLYIY